eukprot:403373907
MTKVSIKLEDLKTMNRFQSRTTRDLFGSSPKEQKVSTPRALNIDIQPLTTTNHESQFTQGNVAGISTNKFNISSSSTNPQTTSNLLKHQKTAFLDFRSKSKNEPQISRSNKISLFRGNTFKNNQLKFGETSDNFQQSLAEVRQSQQLGFSGFKQRSSKQNRKHLSTKVQKLSKFGGLSSKSRRTHLKDSEKMSHSNRIDSDISEQEGDHESDMNDDKSNKLQKKNSLDIKQGISDLKKPYIPDFGYKDQLTFDLHHLNQQYAIPQMSLDSPINSGKKGWQIITSYISSTQAPKFEGVQQTIKKLHQEKQIYQQQLQLKLEQEQQQKAIQKKDQSKKPFFSNLTSYIVKQHYYFGESKDVLNLGSNHKTKEEKRIDELKGYLKEIKENYKNEKISLQRIA